MFKQGKLVSSYLSIAIMLATAIQVRAQQAHTTITNQVVPGKFEPVNVQAPNVASLGSFGNPSVAQFTGTVNIEVPLYTVQESTISVPVTLAYNATGFRPDEHPGWVGMGWGLRAGGVVSRVVNRMPDELNESGSPSMMPVYGFYFTNQILRPSSADWTSQGFLETLANRTFNPAFADTEPDEFSFSLPGCSGTFYKDSDGDNSAYGSIANRGTWRVRCDQPVQVTVNNPTDPFLSVPFAVPTSNVSGTSFYGQNYGNVYPKTFAGFTLTTADGTRYVFGHNEGSSAAPTDRPAIEYSIGLFSQLTDYWTASAWYLTKIISPDGNQVTLTYEREKAGSPGRFVNQMYNSINAQLKTQAKNGNGEWLTQTCSSNQGNEEASVTILNSMSGKLVSPVYLRSITSRTDELTFNRSISREMRYEYFYLDPSQSTARIEDVYRKFTPRGSSNAMGDSNYPFLEAKSNVGSKLSFSNSLAQLQWQKLDAITIKARGQLLRSWQFGYNDNVNASAATTAGQRLTLLQVNEVGSDGSAKPPYVFTYNGLDKLPGYLMFVSDHWGFFNNVTNEAAGSNGALSPNLPYYNHLQDYYATRNPNTTANVYLRGMLTGIKYPTSGTTTFDYEQHSYGSRVDTLRWKLDIGQAGNLPAGGVRIKRITSATVPNPQPGDQVVTDYYYVKEYKPTEILSQLPSSGILNTQIKYTYSNRVFKGTGSYSNSSFSQSVFSSQPILPASGNSQGSHVGYSQIVEKRSDGSYTKYYFSNFDASIDWDGDQPVLLDNGHYDEPPLQALEANKNGTLVYDQFSSRSQERGRLLQQADFTASANCVRRRRTIYTAFDAATDYARFVFGRQLNVCATFAALQGVTYKLNTYAYLPTSVVTTDYGTNGAGSVTTTSNYSYTSYQGRTLNLPARESTQDGKGQVLATEYKYAFDFSNVPAGASDPVARGLAAMPGLNLLNSPIEVRTYRNGQLTGATVQTYTFPSTSSLTVKPYQRWQLELAAPLPSSQYTFAAFTGSGSSATFTYDQKLKLNRTYTGYDARGNCLGMQTAGQVNMAYTWDYGKTLPVSETRNAGPTQVLYAGFESDTALDPATNNVLDPLAWVYDPKLNQRTHLQQGGGVTGRGFYRLDGGWGVSRSNIPTGDYEVTFWAKGGLPNVYVFVDQQLSSSEGPANAQGYKLVRFRVRITKGSINIDAYGRQVDIDDVRMYPVGAQMTSYTHDPGQGVTSTSDVASRPIYYEYDGLQRLRVQRDAEGNITKHLEYHYQQ